MAVARTFYQCDPRYQTLSRQIPCFSLSSRDQVHSKKVIQSAIASSPYYLHVLSSYFANITTRVSCYAATDNELIVASWTLEPAHTLMLDATHTSWYAQLTLDCED